MPSLLARLNSSRFWGFRVRVRGNLFRPPTMDRLLALLLFRLGLMGREEFSLFHSLLVPGMTVVDIGANQGVFTLFCADLVSPTGAVIAFEPDPEMFSAFSDNVKANAKHWVELHNEALGSEQGRLTLQVSAFNRGDNRLVPSNSQLANDGTAVNVVTLDQALKGRKVDLIKMDVQGWEGAVIRGMKGLLSSPNPPWIHLEICPYVLERAGSSFEEIDKILRLHGYILYEAEDRRMILDKAKVAQLKGPLGYLNALAVPPQHQKDQGAI